MPKTSVPPHLAPGFSGTEWCSRAGHNLAASAAQEGVRRPQGCCWVGPEPSFLHHGHLLPSSHLPRVAGARGGRTAAHGPETGNLSPSSSARVSVCAWRVLPHERVCVSARLPRRVDVLCAVSSGPYTLSVGPTVCLSGLLGLVSAPLLFPTGKRLPCGEGSGLPVALAGGFGRCARSVPSHPPDGQQPGVLSRVPSGGVGRSNHRNHRGIATGAPKPLLLRALDEEAPERRSRLGRWPGLAWG